METVQPLLLTLRESTSSTKPCHLVISLEKEFLSSVWPYSKEVDGTSQITPMLIPTPLDKAKDVLSLQLLAVPRTPSLMSTVQEVAEDALHLLEEVDPVPAILLVMDADTTVFLKIMTVRIPMVKIMQDYLSYKYLEEDQAADALMEI